MIFQVASMVGAILILTAFAAQQFQHLETETKTYQMLNLIGGFCLCITAVAMRRTVSFCWKGVGRW